MVARSFPESPSSIISECEVVVDSPITSEMAADKDREKEGEEVEAYETKGDGENKKSKKGGSSKGNKIPTSPSSKEKRRKGLESIYEEQLEKAQKALLQVRENAKVKYLKLQSEHRSLQETQRNSEDEIDRLRSELRSMRTERTTLMRERDAAQLRLIGDAGPDPQRSGGFLSASDVGRDVIVRKLRDAEAEKDSLRKDNDRLKAMLDECTCGCFYASQSQAQSRSRSRRGSGSTTKSDTAVPRRGKSLLAMHDSKSSRSLPAHAGRSADGDRTWSSDSMRMRVDEQKKDHLASSASTRSTTSTSASTITTRGEEEDMEADGSRHGPTTLDRPNRRSLTGRRSGLWARTSSRLLSLLEEEADDNVSVAASLPNPSMPSYSSDFSRHQPRSTSPSPSVKSLPPKRPGPPTTNPRVSASSTIQHQPSSNTGLWARTSSRLLLSLGDEEIINPVMTNSPKTSKPTHSERNAAAVAAATAELVVDDLDGSMSSMNSAGISQIPHQRMARTYSEDGSIGVASTSDSVNYNLNMY